MEDEKTEFSEKRGAELMPGEPESFIIPHTPSPNFTSDFATGAVLSASPTGDWYFLTFFADVVHINSEIAEKDDSPSAYKRKFSGYRINIIPDGIKNIREDKARIALSGSALKNLRDLLNSVEFEEADKNEQR